jgi:uncharacterized membrane protein HdeD (DUF308 family)
MEEVMDKRVGVVGASQEKGCSCRKGHLFLGIFFTLVGIGALYSTVFTSLISVELLGILLACMSVGSLMHCFMSKTWKGIFSSLVMAIFAAILAYFCAFRPLESLLVLTPAFAAFFLVMGVIQMFSAGFIQYLHWEWGMLVGILSCLLGILVLIGWPVSAFWVLGLFVGIDILTTGLGMVFSSISCEC